MAGKKPTSPVQLKILKSLNGFSPLPNSLFICSLKIGFLPFLMDYTGNVAFFLRPFTNALMWRAKETINGGSQMDFIVELL